MKQRKMKDSGIEWIGQIPEDWSVSFVRHQAKLESGHTPSRKNDDYWKPEECVVPWISLSDIWQIRHERTKYIGSTSENISHIGIQNSGARILPKDTVILSRTASVGFSGIMSKPMATTQDFANWICFKHLNPEYLMYSFRGMKHVFKYLSQGSTHKTIYMPDIRKLKIPLPSISTQRAIATFLDKKTEAIDALIDKKQQLITLLEEQRVALINQAVTKGLDPDVPLKESGVEWIGRIPEHWGVLKFGFLTKKLQTGPFGSQLHAEDYVNNEIPVINPSNLSDGQIIADQTKTITKSRASLLDQHKLKHNDIVFSRRGKIGEHGIVTSNNVNWICGTGCLKASLSEDALSPKYASYALRAKSILTWLDQNSVGTTMQNINTSIIANIPWLLPPLAEQEAIAAYLDKELERQDAIIEKTRATIDKLTEYRQALITAAVTGQLNIGEPEDAEDGSPRGEPTDEGFETSPQLKLC